MRCFGFALLAVLALSLAPARASNWKQLLFILINKLCPK